MTSTDNIIMGPLHLFAVVSINFDPIVYNVTEGMSATLRLVLSTTSTEVVTVQINSVDGSATGHKMKLLVLGRIEHSPLLLMYFTKAD